VISFLHPVGKSTIKQGMTVPKSAQSGWLKRIKKGEKVPVTICFGENRKVTAWLRRIDNAVGHLQFRYESRQQEELRTYLAESFPESQDKNAGILEVVEAGDRVFAFRPMPSRERDRPRLTLYRPIFNRLSEEDAEQIPESKGIKRVLTAVSYDAQCGQREYNQRIACAFLEDGWNKEARILKEIGLRTDFEKNGVWVEVEFGNARAYYQDYIKFMLAHRYSSARCGVLLCPTASLAHMLCELGRQRASAKRGGVHRKPPSYSGMMTYEKAAREFPFLDFLFTKRMIVGGLHFTSNETDL